MDVDFTAIFVCAMLFIGAPWIFLHYFTQFRRAKSISIEDENLLDDLHATARRLDARLESIERIIAADNPDWKAGTIGRDRGADRLPDDRHPDDRRDAGEPRLAYRG